MRRFKIHALLGTLFLMMLLAVISSSSLAESVDNNPSSPSAGSLPSPPFLDQDQRKSFASIFEHLDHSLNKVLPSLIALCYLLGLFFILKALYMLKKLGYKTAFMHAGSSMLGPAALIMIGTILMYTPEFLKIMLLSLYGKSEVTSIVEWKATHQSTGGVDSWESSIIPLVGIIQVIGLFAFIRGWVLVMKATGENAPPGNLSKGIMHVVGGVLAINITGTIDLVNQSLGLG